MLPVASLFKGEPSSTNLSKVSKFLLMLGFFESIGGSIAYHFAYFFSICTHFNPFNIGLLGSASGIGSILGSLFGGYFNDKIQAQKLLGLSFFLMGFAFLMLPLTVSFLFSLVLVLLLGFGVNLFLTSSNASLLELSQIMSNSLVITQSYKNVLENAGGIVAMILIMFFAQSHFKFTLLTIGFFFIGLSITILQKLQIPYLPSTTKKNVQSKTNYKSLVPMLLAVFGIGLTYGIQKTVLGIHLNEKIGNSFIIGFFFALDPLLIVLFQVRLSKQLEHFNKHYITALGSILLGFSSLFMGMSTTVIEMLLSLVTFTLGEMLFMANSVTLCYQFGSHNHKGLGIGAWRSAYALGMLIGPLISGIAIFYGSAQCAWNISFFLCIVSAIFIFHLEN